MNILEEFYYGNIDPNTQGFDRKSQVGKAMKILSEQEEQLTELLEGKEKKLFLDFCNVWSEVNGCMVVHKFMSGFQMGMHFTIEGMKEGWKDDIWERVAIRMMAQMVADEVVYFQMIQQKGGRHENNIRANILWWH